MNRGLQTRSWAFLRRAATVANAVVLAALVASADARSSAPGAIDTEALDEFIDRQLAGHLVPGAAIAITRGDEVIHERGHGTARDGAPAGPATQFAVASLSKGLTAVAVMQLVEAGAIDLDAPVQRYLADFSIADARAGRVTVRHLLNHTSGLADIGFPHMTLPQPRSIAERVESLRSARLVAEPGSQFNYFDPNYAVLARLVEVVSDEPFDAYLEGEILEPLGMESSLSLVHSGQFDRAPRLTQGHIGVFGLTVPRDEASGYLAGSTGVVSTAADMARYLMFQAGSHPDGDSVLSADALDELHSPPASVDTAYAMGWVRAEDPRFGPVLHHNGVLGTFHADAVVVPSRGLGVVLLYNSNHALAAYDATWRGILELLDGRSPDATTIDAREIEIAFAALTVVTVALRLRNGLRARGRPSSGAIRSAVRVAWALLPTAMFIALPQVIALTSGRVFSLGQIVAAMPGGSLFLLANAVTGLAAIAAEAAWRSREGRPA
jgi:CubicO group peptidase (beta-lactamase class C family)